jgi:hypothetical protein
MPLLHRRLPLLFGKVGASRELVGSLDIVSPTTETLAGALDVLGAEADVLIGAFSVQDQVELLLGSLDIVHEDLEALQRAVQQRPTGIYQDA